MKEVRNTLDCGSLLPLFGASLLASEFFHLCFAKALSQLRSLALLAQSLRHRRQQAGLRKRQQAAAVQSAVRRCCAHLAP